MRSSKRGLALAGLLAVSTAFWATDWTVLAADHLDPPARTDPAVDSTPDKAADIADVYMWNTATDLVIAVTFAGPQAANSPATYDRDVLYTINVSNAGFPTDAEVQIRWRFGFDANGNAGVQVLGLPDNPTAALQGPVEQTLSRNGILVRAGLYDDPFFFDLQGFRDSKSTGNLSIRNDRNFFAGMNDTAMVIQIPLDMIRGTAVLNVWATTARFGGQI
jgi:hypothetical protein